MVTILTKISSFASQSVGSYICLTVLQLVVLEMAERLESFGATVMYVLAPVQLRKNVWFEDELFLHIRRTLR